MIDYKILEEKHDDAGKLIYQKVNFYTGEMVEKTYQHPVTLQNITATVYERTGLLEQKEYHYE
jgi:hypothetical protein